MWWAHSANYEDLIASIAFHSIVCQTREKKASISSLPMR